MAFVNVWRHMGYTALLIYAGMQMIPKYVYEAAAIDGVRSGTVLADDDAAASGAGDDPGDHRDIVPVFDTVAVTTAAAPVNVTRVMQYYI